MRRCPPGPADRGAVSVEAALALGTLAVFLVVAIGALAAAAASIRCGDAARELVRMAARGEADRGRVVAAHLAPNGAQIELRQDGDTVTGLVTADLLPPLPMTVSGSAVGAVEPGAS